ncbi:MAG: apolipoprotein N-acyltransferase, partial [Elusimicrobia bacterium]|nr:apolipoprotein N-acyltransferase [Elusimicrobiota bacterium]
GIVKINQFSDFNETEENKIKIGIVQPNIAQQMKRGKKYRQKIVKILYKSVESLRDKGCNIILYPETVLPRRLMKYPEIRSLVRSIAKNSDITLIGGKFDEDKRIYNTIFIVDKNGEVVNKYKKKHLVLFGEYVPFQGFLAELFKRIDLTDNLSKNENVEVFDIGSCVLGINICSENYYPYLSREFTLKGATLLTTHSNDAWCDGLSYPYQHFIMNVFRAVENRKYLAVSGNTGISGVISPTGKIIKQTKDSEQTAFEETVYTNSYITIYDRIGDLFVWLCGAYCFCLFIFGIILPWLKKRIR